MQVFMCPRFRDLTKPGIAIAITMPRIAIVTMTSMKVNPAWIPRLGFAFMILAYHISATPVHKKYFYKKKRPLLASEIGLWNHTRIEFKRRQRNWIARKGLIGTGTDRQPLSKE